MIPSTVGFLDKDFEIEKQPSQTYKMDLEGNSVRGFVDEQEAMRQMIFRTLQTERYQYIIYPWYYGIETLDLYDFEFDLTVKGEVHVYFTVKTVYGDIKADKGVKI